MTRQAARAGGMLLAAMITLDPAPLEAQTADQRRTGRIEVEAGGGMLGGAALGSADAGLRPGDAARPPAPVFSTDSRLASAPTLHARVGFAVNRRIGVEGGVVVGHPEIRTAVSGDTENAPPITVAERIDQYGIEASVLVMLPELSLGRRTLPFALAGAGYLRQLHEGRFAVERGRQYHAGGGIKHWLVVRNRGATSAVGLRADARLYVMSGGIAFEDRARPHVAVSGGVFVAF